MTRAYVAAELARLAHAYGRAGAVEYARALRSQASRARRESEPLDVYVSIVARAQAGLR